jgi:predicted RNA-binding Zn-ribbon protein involved in translation (DUF1610 family)
MAIEKHHVLTCVTLFRKRFRFLTQNRDVERIDVQTVKSYTVDLATIKGKGKFRCPKCGVKISPDDRTDKTYTIYEPVMRGNSLEKIVLQCNKCGSQIYLTGFTAMVRIHC